MRRGREPVDPNRPMRKLDKRTRWGKHLLRQEQAMNERQAVVEELRKRKPTREDKNLDLDSRKPRSFLNSRFELIKLVGDWKAAFRLTDKEAIELLLERAFALSPNGLPQKWFMPVPKERSKPRREWKPAIDSVKEGEKWRGLDG